jgi:spore coat protein A, manganese oxidase
MLQGAALGAAGVVGVGVPLGGVLRAKVASRLAPAKMPVPFRRDFVRPPVLGGRQVDVDGVRTTFYEVRAQAGQTEIAPGIGTAIWGYNGTFPGPTVAVRAGEPSVLRVRNRLPVTHPLFGYEFRTSTHLHGSASKPQYDGYANDLTRPGFYKDYHYPNTQGARTMWYHDHAVHTTAQNVYTGLAAAYLVHDAREESLLPQGEFDVPLLINDCILDEGGQLVYDDNGHSGLWGDILLVNGVPWPAMKVKARIYRFRVLAATLGRSFRFRFSNGMPAWVVATDGGLVPTAQRVTSWRHGQAERYEILVDFRGREGQQIELLNLSNPNNVDYANTGRVIRFDVQPANAWPDDGSTIDAIPTVLNPDDPTMRLKPADAVQSRFFRLHRGNGLWVINDQTWDDVVASGFQQVQATPNLGDAEVWTLQNGGGGWFHPTHVHLVDFQILDRDGKPPFDYERGPKDVVYLGEGETVRVLARFGPHRGRYMSHCHNTPHEDHDMMTQFSVGYRAGDPDPDDPIAAAPPLIDDLPV